MRYSSFADALGPLAARMRPVVHEREILRLAATLDSEAVSAARDEILGWVGERTGGQLPPEAREHQAFDHRNGGRTCTAVRIVTDDEDIWAIRANDPDKDVAQRVWITEAVVGYRPGDSARLGVRLLAGSPEPKLDIEPAVPGFVRQLVARCDLCHGKRRLEMAPWRIESGDAVDRLIETLVDPDRRVPLFVLTVPDNAADPLIDPSPMARVTPGIAITAVLPARFTWAFTERFGKRLSVYGGAVRVYLPGFTADADPYGGHDLFLADRLSTEQGRADVSTRLRQVAAAWSLRHLRLGRDVLTWADIRARSLDLERQRLQQAGASDAAQLSAAQSRIDALKDDLAKAIEEQQWLSDEHERAEARAKTAEVQLKAAGYRIQKLVHQFGERGENPDDNVALPSSWKDFADWCDRNLVGQVLLSSQARRDVKAPQFNDIALAARCVRWLANDYRERRLKGGNGDLRVPVESGIQNERCGADSFAVDWQGERRTVDWHIKNGGNTRDPSRCLRIYYFWDDASQQVIVASMPAHIRTGAT